MHPVLAELTLAGRHVTLMAYTTFLAAALAVVFLATIPRAARAGMPLARAWAVLLAAALGAAVGGRTLFWVARPDFYSDGVSSLFTLRREGLSLFGGLLGASAAGYAISRRLRLDPWKLADLATPALGAAIALCRAGCLLNGCCFGRPTNATWALRPPLDESLRAFDGVLGIGGLLSAPGAAVHPLQLYEMAAALTCSALACLVTPRRGRTGSAFVCFLGLFTAWRLVSVPLFWPDTPANHSMAILYAAILLACGLYLLAARVRGRAMHRLRGSDVQSTATGLCRS